MVFVTTGPVSRLYCKEFTQCQQHMVFVTTGPVSRLYCKDFTQCLQHVRFVTIGPVSRLYCKDFTQFLQRMMFVGRSYCKDFTQCLRHVGFVTTGPVSRLYCKDLTQCLQQTMFVNTRAVSQLCKVVTKQLKRWFIWPLVLQRISEWRAHSIGWNKETGVSCWGIVKNWQGNGVTGLRRQISAVRVL